MRKVILLFFVFCTLFAFQTSAQSVHPVSTAFIMTNPSEGRAELMFEEPVMEDVTVVIKDLTGKVMFTLKSDMPGEECKMIPLELEGLRKGIYICQVTAGSGKVKTLKFQKS